jgi:hypothetical protein
VTDGIERRARADRATDALALGLIRAQLTAKPHNISAHAGVYVGDTAYALLRPLLIEERIREHYDCN